MFLGKFVTTFVFVFLMSILLALATCLLYVVLPTHPLQYICYCMLELYGLFADLIIPVGESKNKLTVVLIILEDKPC